MTDRDDFDKIVEGLDLDLSFPDEPGDPVAQDPPPPAWSPEDEVPAEVEEPFYRTVGEAALIPRRRGVLMAWIGLIGSPLSLALATISGIILGRSVVAGASLIFVAAAIYLILQLPEHGPGRRDWPDDGAVL